MRTLGTFADSLAEATDLVTVANRLSELLAGWLREGPDASEDVGVRVYLVGPGDRCTSCPRRAECPSQESCLHLESSVGSYRSPRAHDQRVPQRGTPWGEVLEGGAVARIPSELEGGGDNNAVARLISLEAGGEAVGVVGLRGTAERLDAIDADARVAAFLAASAVRLQQSVGTSERRFKQLLLVNDLGRKVNSILNDDLLLRQAAVDIHRSFGFPNVMIFMADEGRNNLVLRAHASTYAEASGPGRTQVARDEGVVGRVYGSGRTEVVADVSSDASYLGWFPDTKSEMAVPIQNGGVVEGVLNVESDRVGAFGASHHLVLETVANQLAIAIDNARLFSMVKEREDRYRTLVESSPAAVLHLDTEGHLTYVNPAVTEITGYDKGRLLARIGGLEDLAAPADRDRVAGAVEAALHGVPCRDLEFHIAHADGEPRWVSAALQPLVGERDEAKGVVALARDKTREKELQDRLNQSEKLSAIGTLVSGVAHELNNPLAGILGFAQLLLTRPSEEWARTDIEKIEQNARRCQRIVENLLAFARQSRMTMRRANLNEVIEGVLNLNEYQLRMDNVDVTRDFDPMVPSFPIDVNRWQQVFINLANNAHQALREVGSMDKRIHFETRRVEDKVVVRVSDNGPGIPEEMRSRIFEPFFTTKETGTGLGLGICFGIVEEHGGTIYVDPAPREGATLVIEVPLSAKAETPPQLAPVAPVSTAAGSGKRVLVVDDDPYVCDVVRRALENHKYQITVASDAMTAFHLSREQAFDVLLADVRMPGELDGVGLYDMIRDADSDLARRFVFMTGNLLDTSTMDRLSGLEVRCIEKPFDIHALASIVNDVARTPRTTLRS